MSHPRDSLPTWKWHALTVANCFIIIVHGYDVSNVANIQAPIYRAFGHLELLPWVALCYSACSIALMPLGRKIVKFGSFRTLYLGTIFLMIAGAAIAGAAPNIQYVIAGRAVMALGTNVIYQLIMSFNMIFAYPHEFSMVQSYTGGSVAIGLVVGPIIGGAFTDNEHATWRWAFYIVIPLCIISLVLLAICCPNYRVETEKNTWNNLKELDWIGVFLHIASCFLFMVGCTFLSPTGTWGTNTALTVWVLFAFVVITYVIQQTHNIGTTPQNKLLSPYSLFGNRAVFLTWICTVAGSASYGVTLYYMPIYFAFNYGLGPLAVGVRMLPFLLVFIFSIMLSGALLPMIRYYKPFFLAGSAALLIAGGLFQTLHTGSPESKGMGFEALAAIGFGILWQLAAIVCTNFFERVDDRLDLALLSNMAQLGGVSVALVIAGTVYQSTGFESIKASVGNRGFSDEDIVELLSGVDSPIITSGGPEIQSLAVRGVTDAIRMCFIIPLAAGGLSLLAALSLKWEALDFKKPTKEQNPESPAYRHHQQTSTREFLLDDLIIQDEESVNTTKDHNMMQYHG